MAKKHFGKIITFAAVAGAAAAAISYILKYKSFHEELNEDFRDFVDEFEEFGDTNENCGTATRSYVSLNPDRQTEKEENADRTPATEKPEPCSESSKEVEEIAKEVEAKVEEVKANPEEVKTILTKTDETAKEKINETSNAAEQVIGAAAETAENAAKAISESTTIVEDTTV